MVNAEAILSFWFGEPESPEFDTARKVWFIKNPDFDGEIRDRFLLTYQQAAQGELTPWQTQPQTCLALILLLDQFPRNLFRGQPRAFATDVQALNIARFAVQQRFDQQFLPVQRAFFYLPFEHSESLADQVQCLELFGQLADFPEVASYIDYAERHYQVIQRFGRFPHRNSILGRVSTPEEIEFLQQPGSQF
ncbi:MAG: DUF924 domain-containing protein [Oscillatoriales cyanobacterium RM2_1_1]|nr:DUF924 domain-containing protein [Oscillatoriales cyanobacterium SM2_3_0]NJO46183.1 DUF924 domain-containing protein [Oscillatoriales cyanobacterium RM2_1_1]